MTWLEALGLGIIEGLTEFLPVSSTGHMILLSHFLNIPNSSFLKSFEIIIQFGAILAVLWLYKERFFKSLDFFMRLLVAFVPTAILGFALKSAVDHWMGSVLIVGLSLLVGGVVLIWMDKKFVNQNESGKEWEQLQIKDLLKLGLWQSLALVPGVSRSGATILGGLSLGLHRKAATEVSFYLAVPTISAAAGLKFIKIWPEITRDQIQLLGFGFAVAFVVAILAIKFFIALVSKYGFKHFGIYRIALGALVLYQYFF